MPKKVVKNVKKNKMSNAVLTESELQKLAHAGTKEAIAKIEAYWKLEKDAEKKAYAEMCLEECELFYYQPTSEKEDREFMLCVLIRDHEKNIFDYEMEMGRLRSRLEKFELEQAVHEKVLAKNKSKKEDWQYYHVDDFADYDRGRLEEVKENIAYEKAWVEAAKKMISTPKYKNGIPERHLSHFDFGFEDDDRFEDDDCNCGCDCDCCGGDKYSTCCDDDMKMMDEVPF